MLQMLQQIKNICGKTVSPLTILCRHLNLQVHYRLCQKCSLNLVEDDFHSIIVCTTFVSERQKLFDIIEQNSGEWKDLDNEDRFIS